MSVSIFPLKWGAHTHNRSLPLQRFEPRFSWLRAQSSTTGFPSIPQLHEKHVSRISFLFACRNQAWTSYSWLMIPVVFLLLSSRSRRRERPPWVRPCVHASSVCYQWSDKIWGAHMAILGCITLISISAISCVHWVQIPKDFKQRKPSHRVTFAMTHEGSSRESPGKSNPRCSRLIMM